MQTQAEEGVLVTRAGGKWGDGVRLGDALNTNPNRAAEASEPAAGRILVIDDEPAVARLTSLVLEQYGYRVDVVHSGSHALQLLSEETMQLVLVDLTMPDLSGAEVLRVARQRGLRTPMILTSGYPRSEADKCGTEGGFAGYLQKPYKIESLISEIRRVLGDTP